MMERAKWEIIHMPEKPPVSPTNQPTVDVLASVIDPKLANTLVSPEKNPRDSAIKSNSTPGKFPHVKRIQKKHMQGGKTQLAIILCLASENENPLDGIPNDVLELIIPTSLQYAALSKEEWEEQCKLWPTSYHPPTYNIEGITGFSEEDSQSVSAS
ncbi:hypothetical protein CK203_039276 [Vitis vinifera]|uniref:Uncharacterized protein n=1 Tax=Vitis vinifera TaxID=29760 RepID=A0A438HGK0_VITVI|nr:hypothetical protein CK203_039276 [Vitis vinifera]